jgi:hypothetical protein
VTVCVAVAVGALAGAYLFAERVGLCVDGVEGGFCEDQVRPSAAGAVVTALAFGLVALVIVTRLRGRSSRDRGPAEPGDREIDP